MSDWSCRQCRGDGMYWDDEKRCMIVCRCPSGEAKQRWLNMTPEQRREARKKRSRSKKRKSDQEPIPF